MIKLRRRKKLPQRVRIFVDSGAFSVFAGEAKVDIDEYIAFIKKYERYIDAYACLDVIGSAEETWKNQKYMEKKGLNPIIVFHKNESYRWWRKYIETYDYVGVSGFGGRRAVSKENMVRHLDRCFEMVCDTPDHLPKVKVHGFAMTSFKLMLRYPWYSVDSTSWAKTGAYGGVLIPNKRGNEFVYTVAPKKVVFSQRAFYKNSDIKDKAKFFIGHFMTLPEEEQRVVLEYLKLRKIPMGKSRFFDCKKGYQLKPDEVWAVNPKNTEDEKGVVEKIVKPGVCNRHTLRDELNALFYIELGKRMPKYPWSWHKKRTKSFGFGEKK